MVRDDPKVVLAAYGVPGIMAIESLFSLGLSSQGIGLLTHYSDDRNKPLLEFAYCNSIELCSHKPSSEEALEWFDRLAPDVLFSLHYRYRIPRRLLCKPPLGCVNLHPSLLPKYKGCFSIPWAIINGDEFTGFTYHYMDEGFDTGNIIMQKREPIGKKDTAFSLFHRLIVKGMRSFEIVFERVVEYRDLGRAQPAGGDYYPRRLPYGGEIDPSWELDRVQRFIRAMYFPPLNGAIVRLRNHEYVIRSMSDYLSVVDKPEESLR